MENYRITKLNDYQHNDRSKFQNNDYENNKNKETEEIILEDLEMKKEWNEYRNEVEIPWNGKDHESPACIVYNKDKKEKTYFSKDGLPQYKADESGIKTRYEYNHDGKGYKTYHYNENAELVNCFEYDDNGRIINIIQYQ